MHYSPVNYWTPGWIYPRDRLREPFPRRKRKPFTGAYALPSTVDLIRLVNESFTVPTILNETFSIPTIQNESVILP